jgi:hypothetical protein
MTWGQKGQTQLHKQASGRWMNQDGWGQHRQGSSWVEKPVNSINNNVSAVYNINYKMSLLIY